MHVTAHHLTHGVSVARCYYQEQSRVLRQPGIGVFLLGCCFDDLSEQIGEENPFG
jgi:hypothetical protein